MSIKYWKKSPIFPDEYLVSEMGEVKSLRSKKDLKPNEDKSGYLYYVLSVNGERKTVKAHRLVALAFIPNPDGKPSIDHIDGNRKNNSASNLRWVTCKENTNNPLTKQRLLKACCSRDFKAMGELRNFGRKKTRVLKDGKVVREFETQREASVFTNVSPGKVSQCVSGKKKSCKGFEFQEVVDGEE